MTKQRLITDTKHFKLLLAIEAVNKVPCEDYPDFMFPEDIEDLEQRQVAIRLAKALCRSCPIIEECFTYALETAQPYGIWGGTEASER